MHPNTAAPDADAGRPHALRRFTIRLPAPVGGR